MSHHLPVLIVGAGPSGLLMACELARLGIPYRIIDKKSARTQSSNATWVQPRTLELFDKIGLAERFIKAGHACSAINMYADGKPFTSISLKGIDSRYPYILMLPQSKTEALLETFLNELGAKVERTIELIDIQKENNTSICTLQAAEGGTETILCDWVIACDGANSVVREKCGLHFSGEDLSDQFMVADATINFSHLPKDEIHLFFDPGTVLAAFPLGKDRYRLAANLHLKVPRTLFTEIEVIETVQERAHGKYYVTDVAWVSPFWIHSKVANQMRQDSVFLVGDAAHILSPAGGQGMNTGLQDVFNLAWKLALVIQGKANLALLDSYQAERLPVVKAAVMQNEFFTKMAIGDDFLTKLETFRQVLEKDEAAISKKIGDELTQLDVRYQNSPIIEYGANTTLLSAGSRAPDVFVKPKSLYQYFQNVFHNVLLFTGVNADEKTLIALLELQNWLHSIYPDLIKAHIVAHGVLADIKEAMVDPKGEIHQQYGVQNAAIFIIRPDCYIAYCAEDLNKAPIMKFLDRLVGG